jgi:phenylacetic acid degradation operon negative regulatory protein
MQHIEPSTFVNKKMDSVYLTKILSNYPTSNRLLLSLSSQPNLNHMSIRHLIAWGQIFDHEPATIQFAVGRLVKLGFLLAE